MNSETAFILMGTIITTYDVIYHIINVFSICLLKSRKIPYNTYFF